jgi:hypothetical protein
MMTTTSTKAAFASLALAAMSGCSAADDSAGDETTGSKSEAITNGNVGVFRPFQVVIAQVGDGKEPAAMCSGVFVSPHAVLTAAHCEPAVRMTGAVVMRGATVRTPTQVSQLHRTADGKADFRPAPNYACAEPSHPRARWCEHDFYSHDFALVAVDDAYNGPMANGGFDPIATTHEDYSAILLAGYGSDENEQNSGIARYVGTTAIPNPVAKQSFPNEIFYRDEQKSTRGSDSGGPTYISRDGKTSIVGIHEGWVEFVWSNGRLGVDSRVSTDAGWITQTVADIEREFEPEPPPPETPTCNSVQVACGGTAANNCECTNGCFYVAPFTYNNVERGGDVCCAFSCAPNRPECFNPGCKR